MRFTLILLLSLSFPISTNAKLLAKKTAGCLLSKSLTRQQVEENAGLVFQGRYLGLKESTLGNLAIRVLEFKIANSNKTLEIKEWAGVNSPFSANEVSTDKEYIFYFHEPSELGLSSLVGQRQGIKKVTK